MNGPAVLVVEDIPQTRATAVQLFQELGCEVFDTDNGLQALTAACPSRSTFRQIKDRVTTNSALPRPGYDKL